MSITAVNTGLNFYARCSAAVTGTPGAGSITPGSASQTKYRGWSGAANGFYPYVIEWGNAWEMGCTFWNGSVLTRPGPGKDPYFESSTGALLNINTSGGVIACEALPQNIVQPYPVRPPTTSLFSFVTGTVGLSPWWDGDDRCYRLGRSDGGRGGEGYSFAGKAVPTGDWTATMFVTPNFWASPGGYYRYGLGAINSSTGQAMLVCVNTQGNSPRLSSFTMNNNTTYGTFIADWTFNNNWWNPPVWGLRLVKSGSTYSFQVSTNLGCSWDTQGSNSSFTPDKVGAINETFNGVGGNTAITHAVYYSDNDFPG